MQKATAVLALVVVAFPAYSASICVHPEGNGGCETTIQGAVDIAAEGDTIKIKSGTYFEAVEVPPGLDGLIIKGSSPKNTIIDAGGQLNEGFEIQSDNVQLIGVGVNNADGVGVLVVANGFLMKKSQVLNADDDCVQLSGDGAVLEGNRFFGCNGDAVELAGEEAIVNKNRFVHIGGNGLLVTLGDGVLAEKNFCEAVASDCFEILGNGAELSRNAAVTTGDYLADIFGSGALLEGNRATGGGGVVRVEGGNAQVLKNSALDSDGDAISVDCTPDCAQALVEKNRISLTQDGAHCLVLSFATAAGPVMKNTAQNCSGDGLGLDGAGAVTLDGNKVTKTGSPLGACFRVDGAGVKSVLGNKCTGAAGAGFDVDGGAHVLEDNSAKNNAQDGFLLRLNTDGAQLTSNDASGNGEEGFHNSGTNNVFIDNKAKKNRAGADFCDEGTGTVATDNDFASDSSPDCLD